jgi:hypothetical protein
MRNKTIRECQEELIEWEYGSDETRFGTKQQWIRHNRAGCRRKSYHPKDIKAGYCVTCNGYDNRRKGK